MQVSDAVSTTSGPTDSQEARQRVTSRLRFRTRRFLSLSLQDSQVVEEKQGAQKKRRVRRSESLSVPFFPLFFRSHGRVSDLRLRMRLGQRPALLPVSAWTVRVFHRCRIESKSSKTNFESELQSFDFFGLKSLKSSF